MAEYIAVDTSQGGSGCPRGERRAQPVSIIRRVVSLLVATMAVAGGVAGCKGGASVTVDATVPRPLVHPIQAAIGVHLDDDLVNYVHEEEIEEYGSYVLDIGASQGPVFARVFNAMFEGVVAVAPAGRSDEADAAGAGDDPETTDPVDDEPAENDDPDDPVRFVGTDGAVPVVAGIIAPSIEEVQFAIPDRTGGDFYEVWIRYKLTLFDAGGNNLGELPLIGYGKANERNFSQLGQQTPALHEATTWALRDAAAELASRFRDQAQVQSWLASIGVAQ